MFEFISPWYNSDANEVSNFAASNNAILDISIAGLFISTDITLLLVNLPLSTALWADPGPSLSSIALSIVIEALSTSDAVPNASPRLSVYAAAYMSS